MDWSDITDRAAVAMFWTEIVRGKICAFFF